MRLTSLDGSCKAPSIRLGLLSALLLQGCREAEADQQALAQVSDRAHTAYAEQHSQSCSAESNETGLTCYPK